jgi:hypothetical protein
MIRVLTFSAALFCLTLPQAAAGPVRPSDDGMVLAVVAGGRSAAAKELRAARTALSQGPKNLELALATARAAIEQGRTNADPRSYGQAEAALSSWWAEANPPEDVRVLRAVIRQAFHDFKGAASDLDHEIPRPACRGPSCVW